ncbi:MAG: 23S rRNA (guanosine(2251)-2'-O)-methyltransferase RlmB [Bacteroidetes bacterium]|nr:23S rRNA (guanosine(2251)-2'-O)-methyltransferase RlmB [Bacteroidota bacterium]
MENSKNNLIFGIRAISEAITARKNFDKILVKQGFSGDLLNVLKAEKIVYKTVPQSKLDRITRKNHQGIIGFISPVEYQNFEEIITQVFERGEVPFLIILDGITDVRNFGAIARTAECLGVHAIVIPVNNSVTVTPDAVKTSAGALLTVPVCKVNSIAITLEKMKEYGISIIGCTEKASESIFNTDFKGPSAIILGSEETGLSKIALKLADKLVKIPHQGKVSSFNVSVAAGIFLYEIRKQNSMNNQ